MAATEAGSRATRALDELYRRHVAEVYRYAYAMLGNRADAEDVAQTTFMNALRALERGERPRNPSSWLITITRNIVRQRFRQAQARPTEVELDHELAGVEHEDRSGPSVDEMLKALARIPPAQREAIVLREFEGRPYAEIAEILGISTGAFETLLFRARRSLADELENVVTCDRAELAISRRLDQRLSRKERRRLEQHLRECAACARFEQVQRRGRRAFNGLVLVPIPATLTFFKGTNGAAAAAAAALPTIGSPAAVATGGSAAAGGFAAGGLAVKAAAVVATLGVAGGVGYEGVRARDEAPPPARASAEVKRESATSARATAAASVVRPGVVAKLAQGSETSAAHSKPHAKARAADANAETRNRKARAAPGPPERAEPPGSTAQSRRRGASRVDRNGHAGAPAKTTPVARGKTKTRPADATAKSTRAEQAARAKGNSPDKPEKGQGGEQPRDKGGKKD